MPKTLHHREVALLVVSSFSLSSLSHLAKSNISRAQAMDALYVVTYQLLEALRVDCEYMGS